MKVSSPREPQSLPQPIAGPRSASWGVINRQPASIAGNPRYHFVRGDIANRDTIRTMLDELRAGAKSRHQPISFFPQVA